MSDLISIVIPVYNVEKYLEKCIQSVIAQTYTHIEIILVDDGSTDSCPIICDSYSKKDSRIIVYHKENGGLSDARNYGIDKSNGQYITFIDSDDCVDNDYVEYMYNLLKEYNTKMSVCKYRIVKDSKPSQSQYSAQEILLDQKKFLENMLYDVISVSSCCKLYDKSLFKTVRFPKGGLYEDNATTYKLIFQCKNIAVGFQEKYNYVMRENSIVHKEFNVKKLDLIKYTDIMCKEIIELYSDLERAIIRRKVWSRLSILNQLNDDCEYVYLKSELIAFVLAHWKNIILDSKTPFRDKCAVVFLRIHYRLYKLVWDIYSSF